MLINFIYHLAAQIEQSAGNCRLPGRFPKIDFVKIDLDEKRFLLTARGQHGIAVLNINNQFLQNSKYGSIFANFFLPIPETFSKSSGVLK